MIHVNLTKTLLNYLSLIANCFLSIATIISWQIDTVMLFILESFIVKYNIIYHSHIIIVIAQLRGNLLVT